MAANPLMLLPRVVGLTGAKGAGKDTLARVLVEERGAVPIAFADAMKAALYATDPLVVTPDGIRRLAPMVDDLGWDTAKRRYTEVRRLLQNFGVAIRDNVGQSTWIDLARDTAWQALADGRPVVFTDVRFDNEARLVRERFAGTLVRVERPGLAPDNDSHVSEREAAALPVDRVVVNYERDPDVAAESLLGVFDASRYHQPTLI